jgi:hypothetical protein
MNVKAFKTFHPHSRSGVVTLGAQSAYSRLSHNSLSQHVGPSFQNAVFGFPLTIAIGVCKTPIGTMAYSGVHQSSSVLQSRGPHQGLFPSGKCKCPNALNLFPKHFISIGPASASSSRMYGSNAITPLRAPFTEMATSGALNRTKIAWAFVIVQYYATLPV